MTRNTTLSALALALALPTELAAQTIMDVNSLSDIEEIDIQTADGSDLGEVEAVLVDQTGTPVAVSVEVGGFLGMGDTNRVIPLDRLTWQDGGYVIDITEDGVEQLPEWDD